jgi:hypothetical protein
MACNKFSCEYEDANKHCSHVDNLNSCAGLYCEEHSHCCICTTTCEYNRNSKDDAN